VNKTESFQRWKKKIWPGKKSAIHYAELQNLPPWIAMSPYNQVPETEVFRFGAMAITLWGTVGRKDLKLFMEMKGAADEVFGVCARVIYREIDNRCLLTVIGGDIEGVVKLWHYDGFNRQLTDRIMTRGLHC